MKKRVKIPTSKPAEMLELAKRVQEKHIADGEESVLKRLNWQQVSPIIEKAIADHKLAERLRRDMLEAYQQRELAMNVVTEVVRDSRDILMGTFKKEMKVLGKWGFDVLDVRSTQPETEPEELKQTA